MAAERTTTYFFNLQKFMDMIIRQVHKGGSIAKIVLYANVGKR